MYITRPHSLLIDCFGFYAMSSKCDLKFKLSACDIGMSFKYLKSLQKKRKLHKMSS